MRTVKLILIAAVAAAACSPTPRPRAAAGGLTADAFVDVMVELQLAHPQQRDSILQKHGTNEAQIRAFVRSHSVDPAALGTAFDSIQTRVDRVRLETEAPD